MGKIDKILPHNAEAEKAVLGAMIRREKDLVTGLLETMPDHYYMPQNRVIYAAMMHLAMDGITPDEVSLHEYLDKREQLKQAGGISYITELRESTPISGDFEYYKSIVIDNWKRRRVIQTSRDIEKLGFEADLSGQEGYLRAIEMLYSAIDDKKETGRSLGAAANEAFNTLESMGEKGDSNRIATGFYKIDGFLGGGYSRHMHVIAGRPGTGKTTLAVNMAEHMAHNKKKILIFSLEMSDVSLATRVLSSQSGVPIDKIRKGEADQQDFERLRVARDRVKSWYFFIEEKPNADVAYIRLKAQKQKKIYGGLDVIIIDYLQLMPTPGKKNKTEEIADITRSLVHLARELDVVVLLLSQFNREGDKGGPPKVSHLRDSGAIEQDAQTVLMLYDKFPDTNEIDVIMGKNREGRTGTRQIVFNGATYQFRNKNERYITLD